MNIRYYSSVLWLVIGLFPLHVTAATLSGFITDKASGEFLPFANVLIKGTRLGALSNANGYYVIKDIPAGPCTIIYSYVGYETRQETFTFEGSEEKRLDVALTIKPSTVGETVVEADKYEEERTIQTSFITVETQKLRELPAIAETDILRSLQLLPGIQAASDISSGLYIRGGSPDQTLILLDQIPLYNPSHAFGFFSTFNADAIKDMSLHKGAYPAQYGGRLGSVLDVSNKDGNRNAFHGTGGISLISGRLTLEGPVKQGSWMMSGRRTYLDPILAAIRSRGTDVPAYYFYDLNTRVNQDLGNGDRAVASGYFGRDDLDYDLDEGSFINIRWGNTALTGKWTHVFSPSLFGNFMVAGSEYTSETSLSFFETPIFFSDSIRDLSLKGDLDYTINSRHALNAGFMATRYQFSFNQVFNHEKQLDLRLRPTLLSLYLQDQWQPFIDTTVRLGSRSTYFSEGKRLDIEPRLSISHVLTPEVLLKFGAGTYHQYLQLVTTEGFSGGDFWVPLDKTVNPGRSWQTVGAVEWEPSQRYQVSVEGYYTRLRNLVVIDNRMVSDITGDNKSTSEDVFVSGGRGYATGMEIFLQRRTGALTGWIGYTLGWTRRQFTGLNQGKPFPPKYDRRHDLSFVINYRHGRWSFGTNLIYATGQAFTPMAARYTMRSPAIGAVMDEEDFVLPAERNSARLLPYHRLDININHQIRLLSREAEWFIQVFNIYNRRNEWFIQYNTKEPDTEPEVVKMLPVIPTFGIDFKF